MMKIIQFLSLEKITNTKRKKKYSYTSWCDDKGLIVILFYIFVMISRAQLKSTLELGGKKLSRCLLLIFFSLSLCSAGCCGIKYTHKYMSYTHIGSYMLTSTNDDDDVLCYFESEFACTQSAKRHEKNLKKSKYKCQF